MNDYEKILNVLDEHKTHSSLFREETKVGLNTVAMRIEELSNHQKIANGRTSKLESTVHELQKTDAVMAEKFGNMKDGGKKISDRTWSVITTVISVLTGSAIMWIINK